MRTFWCGFTAMQRTDHLLRAMCIWALSEPNRKGLVACTTQGKANALFRLAVAEWPDLVKNDEEMLIV